MQVYTGIYQCMQFSSILSYAIVYGGLQRRSFTNLLFTVAYEAIFSALFWICLYLLPYAIMLYDVMTYPGCEDSKRSAYPGLNDMTYVNIQG